jgi:hypothetical protein
MEDQLFQPRHGMKHSLLRHICSTNHSITRKNDNNSDVLQNQDSSILETKLFDRCYDCPGCKKYTLNNVCHRCIHCLNGVRSSCLQTRCLYESLPLNFFSSASSSKSNSSNVVRAPIIERGKFVYENHNSNDGCNGSKGDDSIHSVNVFNYQRANIADGGGRYNDNGGGDLYITKKRKKRDIKKKYYGKLHVNFSNQLDNIRNQKKYTKRRYKKRRKIGLHHTIKSDSIIGSSSSSSSSSGSGGGGGGGGPERLVDDRCHNCEGCYRSADCQRCLYCKDMRIYGGPGNALGAPCAFRQCYHPNGNNAHNLNYKITKKVGDKRGRKKQIHRISSAATKLELYESTRTNKFIQPPRLYMNDTDYKPVQPLLKRRAALSNLLFISNSSLFVKVTNAIKKILKEMHLWVNDDSIFTKSVQYYQKHSRLDKNMIELSKIDGIGKMIVIATIVVAAIVVVCDFSIMHSVLNSNRLNVFSSLLRYIF